MGIKSDKIKKFIIIMAATMLVAVIAIFIQIAINKKSVESNFISTHERLSRSILEHGYDYYIKGDNDEEQLKCYLSNMSEGINFSKVNVLFSKKTAITDMYRYYDSGLNSMMLDGALLMCERTEPESKKYNYYIYQDPSIKEQLQEMILKYGEDTGEFVFNIKGVFIKDNTFVPASLECYSVGRSGNIGNQKKFYTTAGSKEEMKAEGYSYRSINENFFIGRAAMGDDTFVYCSEPDSERLNRINKLMDKAKDSGKVDGYYYKKSHGLFTIELFCIHANEDANDSHTYFSSAYEKMNLLFEPLSLSALGGRGFLYGELYLLELFIALIAALLIASLLTGLFKRKKPIKKQ